MTALQMLQKQNSDRGFKSQAEGMGFERKQHNKEKRLAVLAVLSAGSRGPIDVVSVRRDYLLLITCKANGYLDPRERRKLEKLKARLPNFCRIQMRYRIGRKLKKRWL